MALNVKSRRKRSSSIAGRLHRGERRGLRVCLTPGGDDVDVLPVPVQDDRGTELAVRTATAAQLRGQRTRELDRVALDRDVHVEVRPAQQDVADGPPDQVHAGVRLRHPAEGPVELGPEVALDVQR